MGRAQTLGKGVARLIDDLGGRDGLIAQGLLRGEPMATTRLLLGVVGIDHLLRLFTKLFDEQEFLSPHGLRAVSAYHREHPYVIEIEGVTASIDYEPAESTTRHVRRQLELAGADLVPAELPRHQRPRALSPVLRGRPDDRVPDRQRAPAHAASRSPTTCASG